MPVTRRQFGLLFAAVPALAPFAAADRDAVIERRVYNRVGAVPSAALLHRCGMKLVAFENSGMQTELTIAFRSLAERTRAWDRFNTHPEWCALREGRDVSLREIAITSL